MSIVNSVSMLKTVVIYIHFLCPVMDTIPPFTQPINREDFKYISSPFGSRINPLTRKNQWHNGIDIAVKNLKTKVYCTAEGIIEELNYDKRKGAYITIKHIGGFKTKYFHLDNVFVRVGEKVSQGQIIAIVGNTGLSTAIHLHYEILFNDEPIDPLLFNRTK